jgi:hypothetical protein
VHIAWAIPAVAHCNSG